MLDPNDPPPIDQRSAALRLILAAKGLDDAQRLIQDPRLALPIALDPRMMDALRSQASGLRNLAQILDPTALLDADLAPPTDPAWRELLARAEGMVEAMTGVHLTTSQPNFDRIMAALLRLRAAGLAVRGRPAPTPREEAASIVRKEFYAADDPAWEQLLATSENLLAALDGERIALRGAAPESALDLRAAIARVKGEPVCDRCGRRKLLGECHGDDQCCEGPGGSAAQPCEGWGRYCCRCGHSYALGQLP